MCKIVTRHNKVTPIDVSWPGCLLEALCLLIAEVQEPYAVAVLLEKDFIMVDLTQSKYVMIGGDSVHLLKLYMQSGHWSLWIQAST